MLKIGMSWHEWYALPLRDRAELITVYKLNNMVELLERHTLEMKRKQKEHGGAGNTFKNATLNRGKKQDYWGNGTS